MKSYTVRQLARLAGVSPRTLHYYDQIGLLKPTTVGENGYRYYGEACAVRLQQVLFFRELDLRLEEIKEILDRPDFDALQALQAHRQALQSRVHRLERLIHTVDQTILHLKGEIPMSQQKLFEGFSEAKQKQYEDEIRQRYGEKAFEGVHDWNRYTPEQKAAIQSEGEAIYRDVVAHMDQGAGSPEVQAVMARWHQHMRYFYEPTVERLRGLGRLYNEHPDFQATFRKIHPDLPEFMEQAIEVYCENLTG
jgi:MerR family transcriptional regulator, thiopeptide resistance regulator